jgi:NAD(P)-dependent dehydrogenase (short-subunit alcohol dehydrogenase family)
MRRVLITGANSGFGFLTTLKFARAGDYVYATARNLDSEGVKKINEISKTENLKITWLKLDITNSQQINECIKIVKENGLDILVNNAGYGALGPIELLTEEEIRKQMETNYFGTVNLTKSFLPFFREQGHGQIITLSSIAGKVAAPLFGVYSASKFAVEGFFESLQTEIKQFNIRVSLIEPGAFKTNFGENLEDRMQMLVKDSAYEEWYVRYSKNKSTWSSNGNSKLLNALRNPERVSNKIYTVSLKRNPKLRYPVGFDANILSFFKKYTPEWIWTFLVNNLMG